MENFYWSSKRSPVAPEQDCDSKLVEPSSCVLPLFQLRDGEITVKELGVEGSRYDNEPPDLRNPGALRL